MPGDWATWSKFSPSEEIADFLKRSAVLQGETAQAGDYVVEGDEFAGAVRPLDPKEEFRGLGRIMDADVERALAGDPDLLCGMVSAVGEGKPVSHAATTSRSIVKLSGRSVVCWVPLGTPLLSIFPSAADSPFQSSQSVEFVS